MDRIAVVLNSENHTIADLPGETLENIFRNLRGLDLINLTKVCQNFNDAIGQSPMCMNKVRVKALSKNEGRSVEDLEKILENTKRRYIHLALHETQSNDCLRFIEKHNKWKSLKMLNCHFKTVKAQMEFMNKLAPYIEEVDFNNVLIDHYHFAGNYSFPLVNFPKLKSLKCGVLGGAFQCSTLERLDVVKDYSNFIETPNRLKQLLQSNSTLEDLSIAYEVLDAVFSHEPNDMSLKLKKMQWRKQSDDTITDGVVDNILAFLKTQKDCLEEFTLDWFSSGRRRRRRSRGIDNEFEVVIYNDANAGNDIGVKALGIIFEEFKSLQKLVIADKRGFLINSECPTASALSLIPNPHITELRLRFDKTLTSDMMFEKLITACPNLKSLKVRELDQSLIEYCSRKLKHLEFLYALSFKAQTLPCKKIQFAKLQRLNFFECIIQNQPELRKIPLIEQKQKVLEMLKNEKKL